MVIDKIRKMSIKGVKLKSESFFNVSWRFGVMEENLRGGGGFRPPPGPDKVNVCRLALKQLSWPLKLLNSLINCLRELSFFTSRGVW